jgi:ribose/xylose/arabinose/galactoside ABC-type transport system permease subunit
MTVSEVTGNRSSREAARGFLRKLLLSENFILYLSILYFVLLIPFIPLIASRTNLENLLSNIWPLFAVAIGQTFVLIIAGIDLSQGAIISITSVLGAMFIAEKVDPNVFSKSPIWGTVLFENGAILSHTALGIPVAILVMLLVGVLIGFLNGSIIAFFKIPAFMVTLVSQMLFGALAIYIVKSENIINLPEFFEKIGTSGFGIISYSMILTVILAIIAQFILSRTVFGRWLYAVGINLRASVVSGIPTNRVIILAYTFSGFCAGFASVLYSSRMMMGRPTLGGPFLLDIIGGAVIGGSSLSGGKGKVIWTLYGVLFLQLLGNSLRLLNVSFFTTEIVKGAVILAAALIDVTRTRLLTSNVERAE